MSPTEGEKQAERWGAMTEQIGGLVDDIKDVKAEQSRQAEVQVEQGKEITKLKTQIAFAAALAGAFGGMVGSLIVGLVLLFAQKGSP